MLNDLPVLTGCGVTLSVAGKGKLPTRTAGNAYTMPHQLLAVGLQSTNSLVVHCVF